MSTTIRSPIAEYLETLHAELAGVHGGKVADYIPELAVADPSRFAIAIATVDGAVYEVGDSRVPFTIQSISKALTFGLVLEDLGERAVRARVGVEPTGEAFNAITLGPRGKPFNPMVNSGAITATSLVSARDGRSPLERILDAHSDYAGRTLKIDQNTARGESRTGHRNRAIAHLLSGAGAIDGDPMEVVERYFKQCSIALDCHDTAIMAATLAAGGVNPLTRKRVTASETARRVLTVMATCGMYDGAGDWLYTVGLPAKSGVSGTIMAVLPGSLGIAVHSPPLDDKGNSVRGVRTCRRLAHDLDLHLVGRHSRYLPVHSQATLADVRSRRVRSDAELAHLNELGHKALTLELRGSLSFTAVEQVARAVIAAATNTSIVVLDLRRVAEIEAVAVRLLTQLGEDLHDAGIRLVLSGVRRHRGEVQRVGRGLTAAKVKLERFDQLEEALEWCEDQLLVAAGALEEPRPIAFADHALLAGITAAQLSQIRAALTLERYPAGTDVVKPGDPGDHIYLITRGRLTTLAHGPDGEVHRIATLVPGMVFGELAFLERRDHSGSIRADTAVTCYVMSRSGLERLQQLEPAAQVALLLNLSRILAGRADSMRTELSARERL